MIEFRPEFVALLLLLFSGGIALKARLKKSGGWKQPNHHNRCRLLHYHIGWWKGDE